ARDHDDRARIGALDVRQRGVDQAHGVQEVDLELVPERLLGAVHVQRADVGDRDVDPAEFLGARLDPADQRIAIGDVEGLAERLDARTLQGLYGARHAVRAARADRDVAALGGERLGDRPPDALAAARDDRPLASEPEIHLAPPAFGDWTVPTASLRRSCWSRSSPRASAASSR